MLKFVFAVTSLLAAVPAFAQVGAVTHSELTTLQNDRRFGEMVNVMSPVFGGSVTAADNSAAIAAAVATGHSVLVPTWLHVTHMAALGPGQHLVCPGRTVAGLTVGADFSPTDPAVVQGSTVEPGSEIDDCGIAFAQPWDQGVRANFRTLAQGCTTGPGGTGCMYPPAVIAPYGSRLVLNRMRISQAWDGVSLTSNPGGLWINDLELGALNVGLKIDNGLDGCHLNGIHSAPFSATGFFSGPLYTGVYSDGQTFAAQFGRCDAMAVQDFMTFEGRVQVLADTTQLDITNLRLDGDHANLETAGGHVRIANVYSTKGVFAEGMIQNTGAELEISNSTMLGANKGPFVQQVGGSTTLTGGYVNQNATDTPALSATGGTLILRGVRMAPIPLPHTAPYIVQSGAGVLDMQGAKFDQGYGASSGVAVSIGSDNAANVVSGNDFGGYSYAPGGNLVLGTYGPNKTPAIPFTVVPHFATPGDSVITLTTRNAYYWPTANGYEGTIRIVFNTNAYTSAAGAFVIDGLPFGTPVSAAAADAATSNVTLWSNISLAPGFSDVVFKLNSPTPSYGLLYQIGSGKPATLLNATDFPPSTSGIELDIHFILPTN